MQNNISNPESHGDLSVSVSEMEQALRVHCQTTVNQLNYLKENNKLIIGLSGAKQSGKNTFARLLSRQLLEQGIESQELSFATKLRFELDELIFERFGIDIFNCINSDKELIRNIMVEWAEVHRKLTNGQYFINYLKKEIEKISSFSFCNVFIITDVRFAEYEYDEAQFIKENGILVHIRKENNPITIRKEIENDPKLINLADYLINWPPTSHETELLYYVNGFINFLKPRLK